MKKFTLSLLVLCLMLFSLVGCTPNKTNADSQNQKQASITIVHKDGSSKKFETTSNQKYLGDAFAKEGIFSGEKGAYGLFIKTADGETVNEKNEEWWCLTKGGEPVTTGIDQTPFENHDAFELTFTVGY